MHWDFTSPESDISSNNFPGSEPTDLLCKL